MKVLYTIHILYTINNKHTDARAACTDNTINNRGHVMIIGNNSGKVSREFCLINIQKYFNVGIIDRCLGPKYRNFFSYSVQFVRRGGRYKIKTFLLHMI